MHAWIVILCPVFFVHQKLTRSSPVAVIADRTCTTNSI